MYIIVGLSLGHVSSKVLGTCWRSDRLALSVDETLLLDIRHMVL